MSKEHIAGKAADFKDGRMKQVEIDEQKILLLRKDGKFYAYGGECPHHGAPLAEGTLHEGHVRCPWHQAVFDAETGDVLQPPALERLARYEVRVDGEDVKVIVPDVQPAPQVPEMAAPDTDADSRTFVIVGAGAAGMAAAETLRREGFQGRIVMLTHEPKIGYDRTDLSKFYLSSRKTDQPIIRSSDFYDQHGIEVLTDRRVTAVDTANKSVTCDGGEQMTYDKLLLVTGGRPRRLGAGGEDLQNVFLLRSMEDCERIRSAGQKGAKAVVVGASFIAMEVAASLNKRGVEVTVAAPEETPFARVFGEQIGNMYRKVHEEKGVTFKLGQFVDHFEGSDGKLQSVVLKNGEKLPADFAVVGVGVVPATDDIDGLETNDDGGITVDRHMRAGEDFFAAGDIATFPDWRIQQSIRIEHWRVAQQQGQTAAGNILDKDVPFDDVPFFWTNQYFVITEYVGHAKKWDDIVFDGDAENQQFLAYYTVDGKVHAVAGCNESRKMDAAAEIMRQGKTPSVDDLRAKINEILK